MTLEEVYNGLGCTQPFDGNGALTKTGITAHKTLAAVLCSLDEMGIVKGWDEDKLDEIEDSN